jgi:hypothetical protein
MLFGISEHMACSMEYYTALLSENSTYEMSFELNIHVDGYMTAFTGFM